MTEITIIEPQLIEGRSFEIISEILGERLQQIPAEQQGIVKRVIHTSADFDYADNLLFSEGAVASALAALRGGCTVVTDTRMAYAGINQRNLERLGSAKNCYIDAPEVAEQAKARGVTRAAVAMQQAAAQTENRIFAVGNAPTALLALRDLILADKLQPALVVGVPVGFVNVVEAKELFWQLAQERNIPCIIAQGRKGGSNVAAAIINALMLAALA
ncbi:MAG: precorrin-8X methylmutase [Firmicutes bacterium]|nr:precorrin-8X methylmutase [Bacillota bacterium]